MSDVVIQAHVPCDSCSSSDGMMIYEDHTYCFVCETYKRTGESPMEVAKKPKKQVPIIPNGDMECKPLKARGIMQDTCRKYGYFVTRDDYGKNVHIANYVGEDGAVLFQKSRDKDKNFFIRGKQKNLFFGQHLFTGGRKLIITEGEIDCLTVSQVQGNKYPVVSLPFGCRSAKDTFKENYEWLCGFNEVIVMFDMDEPGRKATADIGGILPPHKLKIATLPRKDPNECLLAGEATEITNAIWRAAEYRPDGIVNALDLKEELFGEDDSMEGFNFPWCSDLTNKTAGIRKGELLLMTAGSGIGKSTAAREISYKLNREDNLKIGMVMLEEKGTKTARDLLSIHMSTPLHLRWRDEGVKQLANETFDELFGDGRFVLYDHFGSLESDNLLEKIRFMIAGEGCDIIILDHISIAVSGLDSDKSDVKVLDMLMTQLRSLVAETGAGIIVISHLRKTGNNDCPFEEGGAISMDDLRGSGALKQLSDTIIAFERDQQAENEADRNTVRIRVLKCRFTGETGLASGGIRFDKSTNRLSDVLPMDMEKKEEKVDEDNPF